MDEKTINNMENKKKKNINLHENDYCSIRAFIDHYLAWSMWIIR